MRNLFMAMLVVLLCIAGVAIYDQRQTIAAERSELARCQMFLEEALR